MKKLLILMLIGVMMVSTVGCVRSVEVDGRKVSSYGFANKSDAVEGIQYEVSIRNAIWSILALETVVAPVLYFMFYVWTPVGR